MQVFNIIFVCLTSSYFKELRDLYPYRLENLEFFSTALWHLQDDVQLSSLAQDLTRIDKLSPQAWCAAGNCFSRLKEHENAIKFFQRAVQVNPHFAYAYTLLGHEYIMIDEMEKALACFRSATRINPRHYNAWYGIGLTYFRQERYPLADIYYKKALSINSVHPVLMCHVAVVIIICLFYQRIIFILSLITYLGSTCHAENRQGLGNVEQSNNFISQEFLV